MLELLLNNMLVCIIMKNKNLIKIYYNVCNNCINNLIVYYLFVVILNFKKNLKIMLKTFNEILTNFFYYSSHISYFFVIGIINGINYRLRSPPVVAILLLFFRFHLCFIKQTFHSLRSLLLFFF